jgi:hypothetical protein
MPRELDTATLDGAARHYAGLFVQDRKPHDRDWVMQEFFRFTFKDEFEYLIEAAKGEPGPAALKDFEARAEKVLTPRDDTIFVGLLADKLAVDRDGNHIPGKVGTIQLGNRVVGRRVNRRGTVKNLYWPVYAGEGEERVVGSPVPDPLPEGTEPLPVGALNTRISNEVAILMCDAAVDNLDEGTGAAVVQGRTGAQPADPDTVATGTLLFTLVCSDPAFGAAVDANPGGRATAGAITDDASADATGTLGYCRASASNDGATPLDDHIDGEGGTSGADFNFNTVSIVAGATVSMSSWTVTQPES